MEEVKAEGEWPSIGDIDGIGGIEFEEELKK